MENTIQLLKSNGINGAHDLIFMTRYASLAEDSALMAVIGSSLQELTMKATPWLCYALIEYYEATKEEFAKTAAELLLPKCGDMMSNNKAARVFQKEEYLTYGDDPLGNIELYKATFNDEYLKKAINTAGLIREKFKDIFDVKNCYDTDVPSVNSCIAVLFDYIARVDQSEEWVKAREKQNHFVKLLAERFPTDCTFAQCALLSDEFGWNTIAFDDVVPEKILNFYSPTTEFVKRTDSNDSKGKMYFKKNGEFDIINQL